MTIEMTLIIIVNISFTILASKIFFDLFLVFKKNHGRFLSSCLIISSWQTLLVVQNIDMYIVILMSIITLGIFVILLYEDNIVLKLAFDFLFVAMCVFIEFLVGYLSLLFSVDIFSTQLYGSIISKLIIVGMIYMFAYFKKTSGISEYTPKYSWIILATPLSSLLLMFLVFNYNLKNMMILDIKISILMVLILLFANIVVLKLVQLLVRELEIQKCNLRYLEKIQLQKEHSEEIELMLNDVRKVKHDIKHHFTVIRGYLEKDESEKAKVFLDELAGMTWTDNIISDTGCVFVDSVVNSKYLKMKKNNITFKCNINIPSNLPFMGGDISVLIGNIIENAIDATLLLEYNSRKINMNIVYRSNYLIISCVNSYNGEIEKSSQGEIRTTKKDIQNHGMGLLSIKKICRKYNGCANVEYTNLSFTIKCLLLTES